MKRLGASTTPCWRLLLSWTRTKVYVLFAFSTLYALNNLLCPTKFVISNHDHEAFNLKVEKEAKNNTKAEQSHKLSKCLNILTIGGSVTIGSPGFSANHPDAPKCTKNRIEEGGWNCLYDAWPTVLENRLNYDFSCSGDNNDTHVIVNNGASGCSAKCFIDRWHEHIQSFLATDWDVIIIEPTGNTKMNEMNHLRALISSFASMQQSSGIKSPNIILLSASFRLENEDTTRPLEYDQLPDIEEGVSSLATELHIPFVSFPQYMFSNGIYNASNHRMHCLLAECTYWVDYVHLTKTSHRMVADLVLKTLMRNVTDDISTTSGIFLNEWNGLQSFDDLILNISESVKKLLPAVPVYSLSFRTESLPDSMANPKETGGGLVCLDGFQPHNSRGRLSALYNSTLQQNENEGRNATFILGLPSCNMDTFNIRIEYLHSYTTNGNLELMSLTAPVSLWCHDLNISEGVAIGSFNASNPESISVSNSHEFRVSNGATHIHCNVFGGDFHLLSLAVYCVS